MRRDVQDPRQPEGPGPAERLDSWKEISAYLRRTVRTVQRWEQTEGLPIHRMAHDKRSTVYAYKQELDRWWRSRQATKSGRLVAPDAAAQATPRPRLSLPVRRADFYWIMIAALAVVTGAVLLVRL